jgi:hypothetical protein
VSGQTNFVATNQASLAAAISAIDLSGAASAPNTTYTISLAPGPGGAIALTSDLPAINLASGSTLIIQGNGTTLLGNANERGLFVYSGNVAIANLTISNVAAAGGAGGSGFEGGGGGAGLGGGLFVASAGVVGLTNVTFSNDAAIGGAGGGGGGYGLGGGGGLGGPGGAGRGLSGGGGVGRGANGAGPGPAGAGIIQGIQAFASGRYSLAAGGGGGGYYTGGGVGAAGKSGGFGGGGGAYGSGGFGGGAGAFGKSGGFGGGGSGGVDGGPAGFGGGGGQGAGYIYNYYGYRFPAPANGGGGLGAGADVFVQQGGVLNIRAGALLPGTAVGGAAGGPGAGGGAGLGGSLFIQGSQPVFLAPAAGQTLTIGGSIVDQTGSGLNRGVIQLGTLVVDGAGTVVLSAANSYGGGTVVSGGTLGITNDLSAGTGPVVFDPAAHESVLILGGNPANLFANFQAGDSIVLAARPASVGYDTAQHQVFFSNGGSLLFDPTSAPAAIAYDPATGTLTVPCFAEGTPIETERGAVPVQHLRIGARVRLAEGGFGEVVWLGHRRVDCRRHRRPADVWPVRVAAHAFGLDRPRRALRLSPDHAVFVEGVLIPVRYLLNGATLRQEAVACVSYWHVELARHGVLLADGLPAESYLDTGNRAAFANGGKTVMAHPDFARAAWARGGCAPLVTEGPVRELVFRRLIAQAVALGWRAEDAGAGAVRWRAPAQTTRRPAGMRAGSCQKLSAS